MSEILENNQPLDRFRTRKRRDKPPGLLSWHHTRPLRTLRDILSEQGRVYRATVNGILTPDEGAKLMAQTREIRATLEAIVTADAMVAANAPPPPPGNVTINILSVPEGHSVAPNDAGDLVSTPMQTIEHMPPQVDAHVEPEVISEPPPAPEPLDPIRERALAAGWTPLPRRPRIV